MKLDYRYVIGFYVGMMFSAALSLLVTLYARFTP